MTFKPSTLKKKSYYDTFSSLFCLGLAALMILLGDNIKKGVISGLSFSFIALIPTLFPFFILSDLWSSYFKIKEDGIVGRVFEKIFGINAIALSSFVSGLICGFPIGVKSASNLYYLKKITKEEFELLSGFVNNPSAAFIISGVGVGIFDDIKLGLLLYVSLILSSVAVGIFFRKRNTEREKSRFISEQSFNLVDSIKNAGMTSISVASYIVFFSGVMGAMDFFIKNKALLCFISALLEVGSATRLVGDLTDIDMRLRLAITAFALGFSGLSVHLQALSFFPADASIRKYFLMKLIQGLLAAVIIIPLSIIF